MKHLLYILLLFPLIAFSQAPQGINYQAVAYDSDGFELSNKEVGVRISIVEGSAFGTPQLVEEHDVLTTEQGLFSLIIGQGALLGGEVETLLDIPWGSNTYFLKIELDTENNGSYMDFGTQQFMSVPYALYSESTGDKNDADFDPENELQLLSINEDTIFLTEGGYINLPETFSGHYDSLTGTPQNVSQFINDAGYLTQANQFGGSMPSWVFNTGMCSDNIPSVIKSTNDTVSNGNISLNGDHSFCNFTLNEGHTLTIDGNYLILRVSDTLTINGTIDGIGKISTTTVEGGVSGGNGSGCGGVVHPYNSTNYSGGSSQSIINSIIISSNGSQVSNQHYFTPIILNQSLLYGSNGGTGCSVSYSGIDGLTGGAGGAGLILICNNLIFNGEINLSGSNGSDALSNNSGSNSSNWLKGASGGGGGGSIIINANQVLSNTGNIINFGGIGGIGTSYTCLSYNNILSSSDASNGGNGFILWLGDQ